MFVVLLILIFIAKKVWKKQPTNSTSQQTSAQTTTIPARPNPAPPARATANATSSGPGWFWKFIKGVAATVGAVIVLVIAYMTISGVVEFAKDNWPSSKTSNGTYEELVIVQSGRSTTVNLSGKNEWEYDPPEPTKTEFLDSEGLVIPVLCRGKWVAYTISSKINNVESYSKPVRALRFTSVGSSQNQYSFVLKKW